MRISRFRLRTVALLAALALVACGGLTKSPAEGLTFKAPHGWHSSPGIMGMVQFWVSPSDKETLMLLRIPSDWKPEQGLNTADLHDQHVEEQRDVTICGNSSAQYIKSIATSSRTNNDENVEMVLMRSHDDAFMSLYAYPIGTTPEKDAQAALYQLCPAKR